MAGKCTNQDVISYVAKIFVLNIITNLDKLLLIEIVIVLLLTV